MICYSLGNQLTDWPFLKILKPFVWPSLIPTTRVLVIDILSLVTQLGIRVTGSGRWPLHYASLSTCLFLHMCKLISYLKRCNSLFHNFSVAFFIKPWVRRNIHEWCSKSMVTGTVFNKTEMNNEWNVNFLQSSPPSIQTTYSCKFPIWNPSFHKVLSYSFNALHVLKS